jgi:hypothetical protein
MKSFEALQQSISGQTSIPLNDQQLAVSLAGALPFVGTFTGKDSLTFEIRKTR